MFGDGYLNYSKRIISDKFNSVQNTSFSFLIKFDSSGKYQWQNYVGGSFNSQAWCCYYPVPDSEFPLIYNKDNNEIVSAGYNRTELSYTYSPYSDSIKYYTTTPSTELNFVTTYDMGGNFKKFFTVESGHHRMIQNVIYDNENNYYIIGKSTGGRLLINMKDTLQVFYTWPFNTYLGSYIIKANSNWDYEWGKFIMGGRYADIRAIEWTNDSNIMLFGYSTHSTFIDSVYYYFNDTGVAFISLINRDGKILKNTFYTDTNLLIDIIQAKRKGNSTETFVYGFSGFRNNNYKGKFGGLTFKNDAQSYILSKLDSSLAAIWTVRIDGVKQHYLFWTNGGCDYIYDNTIISMYYDPMKGIIYLSGISATDSIQVYFNNDSNLVYNSSNLKYGSIILAINNSNFIGIGPLASRLCQGQTYNLPIAAKAAFGASNKFTLYMCPVDSMFKNADSIATKKNINAGDYISFTLPKNIAGKYKLALKSDSVLLWSNTLEFMVDSVPTASLSASKDSACIGDSILLVASHSHSGKWWLPNMKKPIVKDSIYIVSNNTNYYIYETTNGACTIYDTIKIYVAQKHIANAGADTSVCLGSNFLLLGNGGVYYNWSNGANSAYNYVQINTDTFYVLTVSDSLGCKAYDTVVFKTLPLPLVSWAGMGKKQFCPADDSIMLVAGSPFGGSFSGNGVKGNYFYPKLSGSGKHIINYSIKSNNGCIGRATDMAEVYKQPLAFINITGIFRACEGDSLNLFNADTTSIKKYVWSTGETATIIKAKKTGDYTITVTDTNGCTNTSAAQHLVFNPIPTVYITYTSGKLVAVSNPKGKAWLWRLDGNQQANDSTYEVLNPIKGTYSVKVTDINGCIGYSAAYVFTNIDEIYNNYRSVNNYDENTIYIYKPNPDSYRNKNTSWQLTDAHGRKVLAGAENQNPIVLDMTHNAHGLYTLLLYSNGQCSPVKIVW